MLVAVLCAGVAVLPRGASARPMAPALSGLVIDASCTSTGEACAADRAKYVKLVSQLGFALAPSPARPARTTGLLGFDVSLLASLTSIDSGADYWRQGTRGSGAGENTDPDAFLQHYALDLRKGFGFGIEAGASAGVVPRAGVLTWGGDLRVAVLEGLRAGVWRYLPDTSFGVALSRATGLGELDVGTLAFDARFSHPWESPDGFVLTPWLAYQRVRIAADTAWVDLTPGVSALAECGYAGANVPGNAGSPEVGEAVPASGAPAGVFDGAPLCRAGTGADLASSATFGEAIVHRHRAALGLSYRRELLRVGAELITDLVRPDAAQSDATTARALRCDQSGSSCGPSPRQWTLSVGLGASF